ncbi:adenosine deaminase-like protein [Toxorhynchites rutilus septentrionalis]|uniref:adenosine deaminase-like protein n=1 Tax=Toxorhynchites rutilus septentrionalis TaxID=329112 RepID=UPI0024790AF7|nr:adenosine deaminase-like protein [Toxorhynchites rutilus septentrionalis]
MNFFQKVPKIELHAHLNGSLSNHTLAELKELKYGASEISDSDEYCFYKITNGSNLTLKECFQKFKYAHDLTDQPETLAYATRKVIEEFAADNVVYLELRTTPKSTSSMSKRVYLVIVLEAIRKSNQEIPTITVKLIPSIDRSKGLREAEENVALVLELAKIYPDIIKAMDLSGAPFGTKFSDFRGFLSKAQAGGLKMALHCGEFDDDGEVQEMFEFGTDRIGHGTFVRGESLQFAKTNRIPFECCLTSNVKCSTVRSFEEHHFKALWSEAFAVCICTDDFGVFDTSLSKELEICSNVYGLTTQDILKLQRQTIDYTFASDDEKQFLARIFDGFSDSLKAD